MQNIADLLEEQSTPRQPLAPQSTFMQSYTDSISTAIHTAQITDQYESPIAFESAFQQSMDMLTQPNKIIYFVGNGGSAAIASHMATDFSKNGKIPSLFIGDTSLLTCLSNDLGYHEVFSTPLRQVMRPEDLLVAISSSGNSPNILNAVTAAQSKGAKTITLSGFSPDNALRKLGDINWYLNTPEYGIVENAHQILVHAFLDKIMADRS